MIENAGRFFIPPTRVVREFQLQAVIPPDYLWVRDTVPVEQRKTESGSTIGFVSVSMSFEAWLALDQKEALILAAQGAQPWEIKTNPV
jgi:hypothetical protein